MIGCAGTGGAYRFAQADQHPGRRPTLRLATLDASQDRPARAAHNRLTSCLARAGFTGTTAVACLHSDDLVYRRFQIRMSGPAGPRGSIRAEAARALNLQAAELRVGHYTLDDQGDVIAVIAAGERVRSYAADLEHLGLDVRAIDTSVAAVARCIPAPHRHADVAILEMTPGAWTVAIAREGEPSFVCSYPRGDTGAYASSTPQTPPDPHDKGHYDATLAREARLALQAGILYMTETVAGARLPAIGCVTGAGPSEIPIIEAINQVQPIEFIPASALFQHLARCFPEPHQADRIADWLTPIGLALYDLGGLQLQEAA